MNQRAICLGRFIQKLLSEQTHNYGCVGLHSFIISLNRLKPVLSLPRMHVTLPPERDVFRVT